MWLPIRARARRGPKLGHRRTMPTVESLDQRTLLAAGALGLNTDIQYVDAINNATDWTSVNNVPLTRDANGWPTSDAEIVVMDVRVNEPWNGPDPNAVQPDISGTYSLSFQGSATVAAPSWDTGITVANMSYNLGTNSSTANVVVTQGVGLFLLTFTGTVDPASATGAGVTDVKLILPGYAPNTTQVFATPFLQSLAPFSTLRYLDVDGANDYQPYADSTDTTLTTLNWSQRRLPTDSSQDDSYNGKVGESWEYMVALANATNTNMWINIPGPATDDYVTQLAELIKNGDTVGGVTYAGLNPGLKVYFEYSNEVWGGIYAPAEYVDLAAEAQVEAGGSTLNNDGDTNPYDWAGRYYLQRTMQITNIFRSVFGNDPTYSTIRPVLGWQEGDSYYYQQQFPWFQANYGAPNRWFYGMGNADYYSPTDYSSVNAILSTLQASEASTYATTQNFTTLATYYGLQNVAYEGGPSIGSSNATAGQNALAAARNSGMEAIVQQSQDEFYAAGGNLANFFDGPFGTWSPGQTWSAAEAYEEGTPSLSPKYRGLTDLAAQAPVAVTAGTAVSSTVPTTLTSAYDSLGQSVPNATSGSNFFWLLNAATAGSFDLIMTTATTVAVAPGQVQLYLDDVPIGGVTSINSSATVNFGAISLPAGLSTLSLHVIRGTWDSAQPNNSDYYQWQPTSLTLSPASTPTPLLDAGFESPSVGTGASGDYVYNPTSTPWTFLGMSGVTGNGSGFSGNLAAPQGTQAAFVQETGSIVQVLTTAAGTYSVSFQSSQRTNYGTSQEDFEVLVDGVAVGTFRPGTSYASYSTNGFTLTAGAHTIAFQGLDSVGGDNTAFLDNISIAPVTSSPTVSDAGFESPSVGTGSYNDFAYDPTSTAWTYSGQAGVAGNGSGFTGSLLAPQGTQVGFVQSMGSFSQVVTAAAGTYAISFQSSQRTNYGGRQNFGVLVDGTSVGMFTPGAGYASYTTDTFTLTAGSHTIAFQGLDSVGGDNTAFLDNVSIAPVTSSPTVSDAGFESPSVGTGSYNDFAYDPTSTAWTYSGQAGVAGNGSGFTGSLLAPQGTQVGFVQSMGSFSQVVTAAAGTYAISFQSSQRTNYGTSQEDFEVLVDGVAVGTFRPGTSYASYTTNSFTLTAGAHTIAFQGLDSVGGDNTAFLDAVSVVLA